jgi:ABC-2 type transport system ATP-binding protein
MAQTPESIPRSLRVSGLSKSYAGRPALEDVTFSIHSGEVLGLIGPNNPVLQPPVKGRVGLWSKTDSTSEFKDYVVSAK